MPCDETSSLEAIVQALQAIQRQLDTAGMNMAAIYVEHALEALGDKALGDRALGDRAPEGNASPSTNSNLDRS